MRNVENKTTWVVLWESLLSTALALISWYLKVYGKQNTRTYWSYKVYQKKHLPLLILKKTWEVINLIKKLTHTSFLLHLNLYIFIWYKNLHYTSLHKIKKQKGQPHTLHYQPNHSALKIHRKKQSSSGWRLSSKKIEENQRNP